MLEKIPKKLAEHLQPITDFLNKDIKSIPVENILLSIHATVGFISFPAAGYIQKLIFNEQEYHNIVTEINGTTFTVWMVSFACAIQVKVIMLAAKLVDSVKKWT